jgi:uncharacterized protein YdaU (DUF1376 family)
MKAPAFQLYAADFYMDTLGWTCEEVGLYFRLLMAEWVNGPLPNDEVRLAKTCQLSVKKFHNNFQNVSPKFIQKGEGFLINQRLEETRLEQEHYQEIQRLKGIKSGESRRKKLNRGSTSVQPEGQPKGNPSSSSSSSTTKNKRIKKEKTVTASVTLPSDIDEQVWKDFIEMRNKIKAPLTEAAKKGIITDLEKLGQDKNELLRQSIKNSWRGVFPLREGFTIQKVDTEDYITKALEGRL